MSRLEILANELLLDIFEYMSTAHLIHAFFGLNSRFHQLLYTHFRNRELNFQFIDKQNFDIICRQHLPALTENIFSLYLSNDDETPNLCEHFLSYGFTLDRFIHLKSLSIYYINSSDTINQMIDQCHRLVNLNRLSLIDCQVNKWMISAIINLINNIWQFPKLTHCTINDIELHDECLSRISVISSSIEYLVIGNDDSYINILDHLFKITPRLQRLSIKTTNQMWMSLKRIVFSSLIAFKTSIRYDGHIIMDLFQSMPNLCYLTLDTLNICMDGHEWEKLIVDYLPKLKVFRLKMTFNFSTNGNIYKQIDELVDSFRTSFWIEEHRWYIRCDCYHVNKCNCSTLYTLPYTFNQCSYLDTYYSKSTKYDESDIGSYNHVQYYDEKNIIISSSNKLSLLNTRFPNILHLEITLPLAGYFDSYAFLFHRLNSITVILHSVLGYDQLKMLLDRAYNLYSLKFDSFRGLPEGIFKLTSSSVRRLDLMVAQKNDGNIFNNEDCIGLINSPLGQQCEVLLIEIEDRRNIIDLINRMSHLRTLIFHCKETICDHPKSSSVNEDFIRWLKDNSSSKSIIVTDLGVSRSRSVPWNGERDTFRVPENGERDTFRVPENGERDAFRVLGNENG